VLVKTAKNKFDLNVEINNEILSRSESFAKTAGANGDTLYALQRTAANHYFDDGQFLVKKIIKKNPARLELQLLECDYLDKSQDRAASPGQNKIAGGIELDLYNRAIAYWLFTAHPAETNSKSIRVPAEDIIHVFDRQRASDVYGISGYASVVQNVFRINEYAYSTMDTARLTNHFGIWIESPYVNDYGEVAQPSTTDAGSTGTSTPRHEIINPGGFHYGLPGEKPHLLTPQNPGSQYSPFMTKELQTVSVGAGVGYESVSNDGSQTNFAGSRALLIIERGYTKMAQAIFEEQMHSKIYEWFIEFEHFLSKNPLKMPDYETDKNRYLRVKFSRPVQEWVDPWKDVAARGKRIELRLSTETDEAEDSGRDIEEIYATLAYEKSLRKKMGLTDEKENKFDYGDIDDAENDSKVPAKS
jgi:lambda family phage portal protein